MNPLTVLFLLALAFPFLVALMLGNPLSAPLPGVAGFAFLVTLLAAIGAIMWPDRTAIRLSNAGAVCVLLVLVGAVGLWVFAVLRACGVSL